MRYIRQKRKEIIIFLFFFALLFCSFYLYKIPIEAFIYAFLLSAVLGLIFLVAGFIKTSRKHKALSRLAECEAESVPKLPEEKNIECEDYRKIIKNLKKQIFDLQNDSAAVFNDTVEYYTVWVHQIKTPIASMKLALQNEDSELSRRLLHELFRIEQYVQMVLVFLRLGSDSGDYVFKEYSVDDIIKSSVKKFAAEFIDRKISLQFTPCGKTVLTDSKWLSFVVEQVISNSLKYTPSGSVKIYWQDGICVEDTGIGIAPQDMPRIFEKGYTGANGRRERSSSGLGLYLCRRICQNLGAHITARSEVGVGTTVKITLPQEPNKNVRNIREM